MKDLQNITKEAWSIKRTIESTGMKQERNIFKREYKCHRNTRCIDPKKKSRNINCPAQIIVTVKKYIPRSKTSSDDPLLPEWPCIVQFKHKHNHRLNCIDALRERPLGEEAKLKIGELFERGHSAASAYHTYCALMMDLLGDDYSIKVSDRSIFPTKTDVQTLWRKNFKGNFGEKTGEGMMKQLEANLNEAQKNEGILYGITRIEDNYAVALCTPLMQRTLKLPTVNELLLVDSSGNCDSQNHKIYFFIIQTPAGGLPIGCIISTSLKSEVFDAALQKLIEILPVTIFPSAILTDDDLTEINILRKYWPRSNFLLCTFHVLKAAWKWIQTGSHGILKEDQQLTYKLFRNILIAIDNQGFDEAIKFFHQNCKYPSFVKYVENLLKKKEMWCMLYRNQLLLRGTNTNNYTEITFRLLKDIALDRTKAFNLTQLVDFILKNFESYYKQRLLDLIMNRNTKSVLNRYITSKKDVDQNNIREINNFEYSVLSSSNSTISYIVDMLSGKCTCYVGINGQHCKHQAAVLIKYNMKCSINTLTENNKHQLYKVASGKEPDIEMFLPLQGETNEKTVCIGTVPEQNNNNSQINNEILNGNESPINVLPPQEVNDIKEEWKKHYLDILQKIDEDPATFCPAVKQFLSNKNKYAKTESSLVSGLYTCFKYTGVHCSKRRPALRHGVKISVQPTSVSRRKTSMGGRRAHVAGRNPKGVTTKKNKNPHLLAKCVSECKGLGSNKSKK